MNLLETTQRRLNAAHSGTANFVTHQVESEYGRLIKKLPAKSEMAAQFANAISVCDKARTNPLDLLGRRGLETLKDKSNLSKMTFKPQRALALFSGDRAETRLRKGVNSLADVSSAIMGGYVIHPNATPETARLVAKATQLAADSYASSTSGAYGKSWNKFANFCSKHGVDPWTATDMDVCFFVVARSEETASPNVVEADLKAVMSFWRNANKPLCRVGS